MRWCRHGSPLNGTAACYHGIPREGFCGVTNLGGDCANDVSGAWKLNSLHDCLVACSACAGCRHVSFSRENEDCSWFRECPDRTDEGLSLEVQRLKRTYFTLDVSRLRGLAVNASARECMHHMRATLEGDTAAALADSVPSSFLATHTKPLRLAITTLLYSGGASKPPDTFMAPPWWQIAEAPSVVPPTATTDGGCAAHDAQYQCGMLGWCAGARRLRAALRPLGWRVEIRALLHETPSDDECPDGSKAARLDCPELQVVRIARPLLRAISSLATNTTTSPMLRLTLAKWNGAPSTSKPEPETLSPDPSLNLIRSRELACAA